MIITYYYWHFHNTYCFKWSMLNSCARTSARFDVAPNGFGLGKWSTRIQGINVSGAHLRAYLAQQHFTGAKQLIVIRLKWSWYQQNSHFLDIPSFNLACFGNVSATCGRSPKTMLTIPLNIERLSFVQPSTLICFNIVSLPAMGSFGVWYHICI